MSTTGIGIVAKQEFRVRLRTRMWRWLLVAWFVTIAGFTVLLRFGLASASHMRVADSSSSSLASDFTGIPMFGGLMLFVLGLGLLVAPALTAQSINGDRERGTLATVQVTLLSAGEIAVGKLIAAWGTMLAFLAATLPLVVWALLEGGVGIGRACVVLVIVALLLGVICAVSQAFSALFARGITTTLVSYLLVFALSAGTLVVFGLAMPMTRRMERIHTDESEYATVMQPHPENIWWLLAPNPFVILADAAPAPPLQPDPFTHRLRPVTAMDPLSSIGQSVRETRTPQQSESTSSARSRAERSGLAVWPYGFALNLLVGTGSVWISAHRLRTPARKLPNGVRIA